MGTDPTLGGGPQSGLNYEEKGNLTYYYKAEDGSVFRVEIPVLWGRPRRVYVSGPKTGQSAPVDNCELQQLQEIGEKQWGKYIPGGWTTPPRFIPGTDRTTIPLVDIFGRVIGYIDENGPHYFPWEPSIIA